MRRKYTLAQLRSMLVGRRWVEFHRSKHTQTKKDRRLICVNNVFFSCYVTKHLLRPCLEVRAQSHIVAMRLIDKGLSEYLMNDLTSDLRWDYLSQFGYILNGIEGYEPVEAAQDIA
jgi:hypothetical protein